MPKQDFIPDREGDFVAWHDNFKIQFAAVAGSIGFGGGDINKVNTENAKLHADVTAATVKKTEAKAATAAKRATIGEIEDHDRRLAARAKTHPNYTEAIGKQLGIIGPDEPVPPVPPQPALRAELVENQNVVLSFVKGGYDGVVILSQRGDETDFTPLARDLHSPYVDNRPSLDSNTPETRQYRAQYLDGDDPVGPLSDILPVTVPEK